MWVVAFEAVVLHWLMFDFALPERIIMAFETYRPAGANQELLVRRLVRIMAGLAIAILDGLMRHLCFLEKVIVTLETKLLRGLTRLRVSGS